MRPTDALPLLLSPAVVAGHLLLVRELLARLYRLAMPWLVWMTVVGVLLASCVVVPALLGRAVGRHGPRVFRGGTLADVPIAWLAYAVCCLGALLPTFLERARAR